MKTMLSALCAMAAFAVVEDGFWDGPPADRPPACVITSAMSTAFESRSNVAVRVDGLNLDTNPRGFLIIFR